MINSSMIIRCIIIEENNHIRHFAGLTVPMDSVVSLSFYDYFEHGKAPVYKDSEVCVITQHYV